MNEFQKALIDVLKGIHYELKRLNDTNPSNQAQAKPKQDKKNHLNQKLYLGGTHESRNVKMVVYLSRW